MGALSNIASSLILRASDVIIGRVKITDGTDVALVTSAGALSVHEVDNDVDGGNSTTATLAGDAVFTGTGMDVLGYGAVTIQLDSSHDSATNGMSFQFSPDNTNWDSVHVFTYVAADGARVFQFTAHARYFRVVYTNGNTQQTHLRIQTILHHTTTPITSIHRLVDDTSPDRSAELVKAALIAQAAGTGDFKPVQATAGGNLKMSIEEFSDGVDVGNGTVGSETLRITLATDSTGVVSLVPQTTGGLSAFSSVDLDQTEEEIKGSAGQIYTVYAWNATAAPLWLQIFNDVASNVTVGGTAPTWNFPVPANADSDIAGVMIPMAQGLTCGTGITMALTGAAGTDATDPGASAGGVFVTYK